MINLSILISFAILSNIERIPGNNTRGPFYIKDTFILQNSEKISLNDATIEKEDYEINYTKGIVYLKNSLSIDDTLHIIYEKLPFDLKLEYFHCRLEDSLPVTESTTPSVIARSETKQSPDKSFIQGDKTFGISFGTGRDLSFDQSMHININGNITKDVKIQGVLKDDNLPIQPEGTTEDLRGIDKIFVNVQAKHSKVTFGDFEPEMNNSMFGILNRKLEGARGEIWTNSGNAKLMVGGALSKGKFKRVNLEGKLGKQGPYELVAGSPGNGVIIAGSEKVFLNKKLQNRGKDYTIEYSSGTLTFTSQKVIEDGDEIDVEFQYNEEGITSWGSKRMTYIGEGSLRHKNWNLKMQVFDEQDILHQSDSDKFKEIETDKTWIDGGEYVGKGNGSYIKTVDGQQSTVDSIYFYMGYGNGDWQVSFTDVGEGNGEYEFDNSIGGYVWTEQGRYIPKIEISLPEENGIFITGLQGTFGDTKLGIEFGMSKSDKNRYSPSSKTGSAYGVSFISQKKLYSIETKFMNLDDKFLFPGNGDTTSSEHLAGKTIEGKLILTPKSFLKLNGGYKKVGSRKYEVGSREEEYGFAITPSALPNLSYDHLERKGEQDEVKEDRGEASLPNFQFTPFVKYETKQRNYRKGIKKGIGIRGSNFLIEANQENIDSSGMHLENIGSLKISFSRKDILLNWTHKEIVGGVSQNEKMDFGGLNARKNMFKDRLSLGVDYDISSTEKKLMREEYYKVEQGKGSYSFDTLCGEYYPDRDGDYEKRLIPVTEPEMSRKFSLIHRIDVSPLSFIDLNLQLGKIGEGKRISFRKMKDAYIDRNFLRTGIQVYNFSINYRREDYYDNRIQGRQVFRKREGTELSFTKNFFEASVDRTLDERRVFDNLEWRELKRDLRFTIYDLSLRGAERRSNLKNKIASLSLAMTLENREIRDIIFSPEGDISLNAISICPGLVYNFKKGVFESGIGLTYRASGSQGFLPPDVNALYPLGMTKKWNISLQVKSDKKISYLIQYSGEARPSKKITHTGSCEARMNF